MRVYVAHLSDRHCDHQVKVFRKVKDSITHAEEWAKNGAEHNDCKVIEHRNPPDGWLYYARYSEEGDCVWVTEEELEGVDEIKEQFAKDVVATQQFYYPKPICQNRPPEVAGGMNACLSCPLSKTCRLLFIE